MESQPQNTESGIFLKTFAHISIKYFLHTWFLTKFIKK